MAEKKNTDTPLYEGKVICYLVGAGPGNYGLVTQRALQLIRRAAVIIYDRLVPNNILDEAKFDCKKIFVGKSGYKKSILQSAINKLLVQECLVAFRQEAKQKKPSLPALVVRLKGGDPMLFGRAAEEMQALKNAGIPFAIAPGVSSAFAVPAYAGIPLTARGKSHSVSFVTGKLADKKKLQIIATSDTVVYLMAVSNIAEIVKKNLEAGKNATTPVALIANGTLSRQQVVLGTLNTIEKKMATQNIQHPGLLVVGKVAKYSSSFSWFTSKPFYGKRIGLFRQLNELPNWVEELEEESGDVISLPLVSSKSLNSQHKAMRQCLTARWGNCIVFSSPRAVDLFMQALHKHNEDIRKLAGVVVVAVGESTAALLQTFGLRDVLVPKGRGQEGLLNTLTRLNKKQTKGTTSAASLKVLYPRAKEVRSFLLDNLEAMDIPVRSFLLYENFINKLTKAEKSEFLRLDFMVFSAKKSVDSFFYNFAKEFGSLSWRQKNYQQFPKFVFFDRNSEQAFKVYAQKYNLEKLVVISKAKKPTVFCLKECLLELIA